MLCSVAAGVPKRQRRSFLGTGRSVNVLSPIFITSLKLTPVHRSQHTGDEAVNTPAFFDKGNQSRDTTLVVDRVSEVREHHFLERLNLILQPHQI